MNYLENFSIQKTSVSTYDNVPDFVPTVANKENGSAQLEKIVKKKMVKRKSNKKIIKPKKEISVSPAREEEFDYDSDSEAQEVGGRELDLENERSYKIGLDEDRKEAIRNKKLSQKNKLKRKISHKNDMPTKKRRKN